MASGKSGSMQSSSDGGGGDEEYDSRSESISPFFNPSSFSFGSIANHPQPPPSPPQQPHTSSATVSHQQNFPPTFFDPQAHTLGPLANLDLAWTRGGLGSEPNYTDLGNLTGLSSLPSSSASQSLLGFQGSNHDDFSTDGKGISTGRAAPRSDQTNVGKTSRKRTRASRRAPTTVLTTDTLNFRQMVQEFTGIPAPPFSSSPYSSRPMDLFGGSSGGALRSGHLETTLGVGHLYPFRPSAQKLQPSPFLSSSSSPSLILKNSTVIDSAMASTSHDGDHDAGSTNPTLVTSMAGPGSGPGHSNTFSTSTNYQLAPDLDLLSKQPQLMPNIQNPFLTFQSLVQSPIKYPLTRPSLDDDQFGGFSSGDGGQEHLGTFDGNNNGGYQKVSGYKLLNCSASSSSVFRHEKGLENVSSLSRNGGTVESWICPSD
ncbi:hypothetical protein U1Q18_037670 [Sarracenia purpurea var. burkii]